MYHAVNDIFKVQLIPLELFELIRMYLKECDYTTYMDINIATLPKKGLNTRPYNIDMEKRDFKTIPYNIDMEKKDLKKRTKGQLIKLLMNQ